MSRIFFSCIILCLCLTSSASEPMDYTMQPRRISYFMQPRLLYSMQPKVLKSQPKVEDKKEVKEPVKTGYVCDENGCRPANTTYTRYRIFRRR